jgi:hypothetical protein
MTLGDELDGRLAPGRVRVEQDGRTAEVDVADVDRLGVSVRGIKIGGGTGGVLGQAARLPEATSVLPERVQPVEVDAGLGGAVLRSVPRHREYFEVRTNGHEATIERLRGGPEGRVRIPFTLTREQLGRLVDDVGEGMRPDE